MRQNGFAPVTGGLSVTGFQPGVTQYDYNQVNQLLSASNPEKNFSYDNDGNMIEGYTPDGYRLTAGYDAENRLSSVEFTDSNSVVHKTVFTYRWDNFLGRIQQYESSIQTSDTRIVRGESLALQDRDESNNVTREYGWGQNLGGGIGGLLNLRQDGADYSYLYDGKGNVTTVLDSTQASVASYGYNAFGRLMVGSGTLDQPYQFSTKRYDHATGLSYYGYRFYNPAVERWMNRDPLGEVGGINLYGFVRGNPVNFIDPEGLFIVQGVIVIGTLSTLAYFIHEASEAQQKVDKLNDLNNDLYDELDSGIHNPNKAEAIRSQCNSQEEQLRKDDFPNLVKRGFEMSEPASNLPSIPFPRDSK